MKKLYNSFVLSFISFFNLQYNIYLYCWLLAKSSPPGNIFHKTHSSIVCGKMHTNFLEMLWNPLSRKPIIFHCRLTEFMIVSYKKRMSRFHLMLEAKTYTKRGFSIPYKQAVIVIPEIFTLCLDASSTISWVAVLFQHLFVQRLENSVMLWYFPS